MNPSTLRKRHLVPELMDDPNLEPAQHRVALRGLARLNWVGNAAGILLPLLKREHAGGQIRPLRVLDLGCGSGDVLNALSSKSKGRIRGLGIDISPTAIEQAKRNAPKGTAYRVQDALDVSRELPRCDVAVSSLFFHHLTDDQALNLLVRMARCARRAVIVSDLERSMASWCLVWLGAHFLSRSRIVHYDSARSVEAGWTVRELKSLARRAGLKNVTLKRAFPARVVLIVRTG